VLHNELSNLYFDVVALQETQSESGIQKFVNFTIYRLQDEVRDDGRIVGGEGWQEKV
jgi:hypothetical protein